MSLCRWRAAVTFSLLGGLLTGADGRSEPAEEPAVTAVRKALPAVVNISAERIIRRRVYDPMDRLFYEFFGGPMVPPRELRQRVYSLGSGFFIDRDGHIITNEHVVQRAAEMRIQVRTTDGNVYAARYLAGDPETDLALIKVEGETEFPFISLDKLSPNLLGQTVLALGNPVGYGSSVTRGILSAKERAVVVGNSEFRNLLQTDVAINPGNSGGPLIDLSARLVGVSSVKMAYTPQGVPTQGIGFAIPGELVRKRVTELLKGQQQASRAGSAAERLLGLQLQELTKELAGALGYEPGRGVLIVDVARNSPSGASGLKRGLVIFAVGQYQVNSIKRVESLLAGVSRGDVVRITYGRSRRRGNAYVAEVEEARLRAR